MRVLGDKKHGELHGRVFGVIPGHQLRLRFGEVEGESVGLREDGDPEKEEGECEREREPEPEPLLLPDHLVQRHVADEKEDGKEAEPQCDLVGYHLRTRPQSPEQCVLVGARPPRHHDPVDAER